MLSKLSNNYHKVWTLKVNPGPDGVVVGAFVTGVEVEPEPVGVTVGGWVGGCVGALHASLALFDAGGLKPGWHWPHVLGVKQVYLFNDKQLDGHDTIQFMPDNTYPSIIIKYEIKTKLDTILMVERVKCWIVTC